jgi:hypothetical protein
MGHGVQTFKDTDGRQWTVALTAYSISRVKRGCGLDLFAVLDDWPRGAEKLAADPALFVNAVYLLVTAQKDAPQAEEDFCRAVDGATMDAMSEAFHDAVLDFFRRSPRGPTLAKIREKAARLTELAAGRALERVAALDPAKMLDAMFAPSKNGSTDSPGSSASSPAP